MYGVAVASTALVMVALWPWAGEAPARRPAGDSEAPGGDARPRASMVSALAAVEESGYEMESVEVAEEDEVRRLDMVVKRRGRPLGRLLDGLAAIEGVRRPRSPSSRLRARLASGNAHKLEELRRALPGWEVEALPPTVAGGTGATYEDNARIKATSRVPRRPRTSGSSRTTLVSRRPRSAAGRASTRRGGAGHGLRRCSRSSTAGTIARAATCASSSRSRRAEAKVVARGVLAGSFAEEPGQRGLRLRPHLRPFRRVADGRGARERVEGRALPPRPRRPGARRATGALTAERPQSRRGRARVVEEELRAAIEARRSRRRDGAGRHRAFVARIEQRLAHGRRRRAGAQAEARAPEGAHPRRDGHRHTAARDRGDLHRPRRRDRSVRGDRGRRPRLER